MRFLIQDVQVEGAAFEAVTGILRPPGRLRVTLPEGSWEGGYVYVPGTPVAMRVDGAADSNGTLLLDSLPACRLKSVLLARRGRPGPGRVLGTDVVIQPGATSALPFTEWAYSAPVRVNAAGLASRPVPGIPLLLRFGAPEFAFAQARGDGSDLRFTKEDGTILPVQVQQWDSAAGRAAVWVRLDTVFADSAPRRIRMHWGNPRAPAYRGNVFDTADGYAGVWHLDGPAAGVPAAYADPDASPAGNPARALGGPAGAAFASEGRIGASALLDGRAGYLAAAREYAGPSAFTASFWFRTASREGGKMLGFVMPGLTVNYGNASSNFNFDRVVWMTDEGWLHAGFTMRSTSYPTIIGAWQSFASARPYNDGQWHLLAYTVWDAGALLAVDGVKAAGFSGPVRPLPERGHWQVGYSGEGKWDPEWTSEYFQGQVDEVRLIHAARGEDWLRLDYESQKPGSTVLSLDRNP